MNRDGYRDQIVTCDVGVSLNSKTHSLFMKYSNGTSKQCYAYHYPSLFPVLFLQSLFNSKNFSFTCLHSFFTCLKQIACFYYSSANQELTYGEAYINYVYSTLTECVPLIAPVLTCSTDSSPQNVLTCNIALKLATQF